MGDPDVGDDPDLGAGEGAELGDVPGEAGSHLHDQGVDVLGRTEHGHRHPDLVVERLRRSVRPQSSSERSGGQVLGGGLAHRPGDRDHAPGEAHARGPGQLDQSDTCVGHHDRRSGWGAVIHDHERGSVRERIRDELVAIAHVVERDEHLIGTQAACVECDPAPDRLGRELGSDEVSSGDLGHPRAGQLHTASSSSAATTRSSNGSSRAPRTCRCSAPFPSTSTVSPGFAAARAACIAALRSSSTV